jgi:hypothetical protein
VNQAGLPLDMDELRSAAEQAMVRLEKEGVREVVVKPALGEQARGMRCFALPQGRCEAVEHASGLALESAVVLQERVRPPGGVDYNFRVMVASTPGGEPRVVGRFARMGLGDDVEMVPDEEMLRRAGLPPKEAEALLKRMNAVSLDAFRAVVEQTREQHPRFPWRPLGGGSYHVPYILGVDLIGDARIMEVNGNEVAGMWTDDRLYPETRGRTSRTVLESAREAALAYREALRRA